MKYAKAQRILRGEATASKFQTKAQSIIEDFLIDKVQRQSSINGATAELGQAENPHSAGEGTATLGWKREKKERQVSCPLRWKR